MIFSKNTTAFIFILFTISLSCSSQKYNIPTFINFDNPGIIYNYTILQKANGIYNADNNYNFTYSKSLLKLLNASILQLPDNNIGKLNPLYPIVKIVNIYPDRKSTNIKQYLQDGYLYSFKAMRTSYYRYGIFIDNKWIIVSNHVVLKKLFAPIENENEAFSYAILSTGYYTHFGLKYDKDYRYLVDKISDSYAIKHNEEYIVLLYTSDNKCGEGPFPEYSMKLSVNKNGDISILKKQKVFEDKAELILCD